MSAHSFYRGQVNQNLFFARTLLAQEVQQNVNLSRSLLEEQLNKALLEGAVLLLHRAYQLYLHELAEYYQCRSVVMSHLKELISALDELGKTSAEVQELEALEGDPANWLGELKLACAVDKLEQANGPLGHKRNVSAGIALKQESSATLTVEQALSWHSAFEDMLVRQRGLMLEW